MGITRNIFCSVELIYDRKSGARMPLITTHGRPYAFRAALDARRSGLERMAGELRHD